MVSLLVFMIDAALGVTPVQPQVAGGQEVEECGWPDTVAVTGGGGLCTGSLVHPRVVVYAAHCGDGNKTIRFAEDSTSGGISRPTSFCRANPEYDGVSEQSQDWAFCVLDEPVTELPYTPPAYGCETDVIAQGQQVVIAGFGDSSSTGGAGTKRWATTEIVSTLGSTANIGGDGVSTCQGDSGGSAFVQFPDGGWRALSMTSTGIGCGKAGVHALMHPAVPWIENESGIDITPCHDQDGTWNPTANCGSFFAGNEVGHGTWDDWCTGTPVGGIVDTCGAAYDASAEADPPAVTITAPADGEMFDSGALVSVAIDAVDDAAGVNEVWIEIEGMEQAVRDGVSPYAFEDIEFPDGVFTIVAHAVDWSGKQGTSAPVTIGVNAEVPDDTGPAESSGSDTEVPTTSATTTDPTDPDDDDGDGTSTDATARGDGGGGDGCNCRSGGGGPVWIAGLLVLAWRRRVNAAP
jgi:MYXO-CTERM domain-containing protein